MRTREYCHKGCGEIRNLAAAWVVEVGIEVEGRNYKSLEGRVSKMKGCLVEVSTKGSEWISGEVEWIDKPSS
jgi:hypothetical protein